MINRLYYDVEESYHGQVEEKEIKKAGSKGTIK